MENVITWVLASKGPIGPISWVQELSTIHQELATPGGRESRPHPKLKQNYKKNIGAARQQNHKKTISKAIKNHAKKNNNETKKLFFEQLSL